jgi:serine phosphatase RsbU (regulator of sigma subunit)
LQAGQKIVLISDGVVEARSASGELLGFDRLAPLTIKSAREIADSAKAFGQQDDITALTLARTA